MKIKTSELEGPGLDWAVAKCKGEAYSPDTTTNGIGMEFPATDYSTNWSQGGPIIEREGISVFRLDHKYKVDTKGYTTSKRIPVFGAVMGEYFDTDMQRNSYGESYGEIYYIDVELVTTGCTPLIAAMRCYVASKLGDEIETPDTLVKQLGV